MPYVVKNTYVPYVVKNTYVPYVVKKTYVPYVVKNPSCALCGKKTPPLVLKKPPHPMC